MAQFTLNDFYNRIDYLTEKSTLEELLDFLEVQCVKGSERDVYNIANTGFMAFEVLLDESEVRFQTFSPNSATKEEVETFFLMLFEEHRGLLFRLLKLLDEKYSHLGSLTYKECYRSGCYAFCIKKMEGNYDITSKV